MTEDFAVTQPNILGPYFAPHHYYPEDQEYMRRLDPAWVNIHQPTARAIHVVHQCAPHAKVMLRSWDIDDHNGDRKREMYQDPRGAARLHMASWETKWAELENELKANGWSYDTSKWYMSLVNEPDPGKVPQVVEYTLEAMEIAQRRARRLGVVCSSVGTFSKPSEDNRGWALCKPLEKPINEGGHILIVHEYWDPRGPSFGEDAGNLAWRHQHIPVDVPILIREAGANGYIFNRFTNRDDGGWRRFVPDPKPETYAAQVKEYIEGCDQRVQGVLLYMLDYHDENWWSFYTGPAMEQLLAIKEARPQKPSPFTVHLPGIFNGKAPTTRFEKGDIVRTTTKVNARQAPGTQNTVLTVLEADVPLELLEGPQSANGLVWWRTERGWVAEVAPNGMALLSSLVALPPNDKWERCMHFVARWEGGWADNPNDPGGATNRGITIGTYTRWRAAHGQPAPTKEDLRNITTAEVDQIYREWYWQASGADQLQWPLCLAVFDLAVNGGVDRAKEFINEVGLDFTRLMARRLHWYTNLDGWKHFGNAWTRRCADLMKEATKGG